MKPMVMDASDMGNETQTREYIEKTVYRAQDTLKRKYGINATIAETQAALWYFEKEMLAKQGIKGVGIEKTSYADFAAEVFHGK